MKSLKLKVSGLHCPGCVSSVQKALLSTKGIKSAKVDIATDIATVEFIEGKVTADKLVSVVEKIGFEAKPLS